MFSNHFPISRGALKIALSLASLSLTAAAATTAPTVSQAVDGEVAAPAPPPAMQALPAVPAHGAPTVPATAASAEQPAPPPHADEPLAVEEEKLVEMMGEILRGEGKSAASSPPATGSQLDLAREDPNLALRRYSESERRKRLNAFASAFYRVLPQRNLELLKMLCAHPFYFEGRRIESEQAFEAEWARIFANLRLGAVPMKRMQIFSAEEMVRHFGERPAKIADWPVDEASYFSIAEFGAQVIIVLWRQSGDLFMAEAIHG